MESVDGEVPTVDVDPVGSIAFKVHPAPILSILGGFDWLVLLDWLTLSGMNRERRWWIWLMAGGSVLALLLLMGLGVVGGWMLARGFGGAGGPVIAATPTLVQKVQSLNQLVSVKYVLEKIVLVEDAKWYGDSRLLMVAHGVAKAGVDLSKVGKGDVRVHGTTVQLSLPRPVILDVYLDERRTQVVERSTGVLRGFDKDLEQDARRQAVDQIKVAVRDSGILKDAEERARIQVEGLLKQSGFTEIGITFR